MLSSASDKDDDDNDNDSNSSDYAPSYLNVSVYSNGRRTLKLCSHTVLSQAEKFSVQQIPASEAVGTGVSCPVKDWVGTELHSNASLSAELWILKVP